MKQINIGDIIKCHWLFNKKTGKEEYTIGIVVKKEEPTMSFKGDVVLFHLYAIFDSNETEETKLTKRVLRYKVLRSNVSKIA